MQYILIKCILCQLLVVLFWQLLDVCRTSIVDVHFWQLLDVCRTSIVDVHIMSEHRRPTDLWKLSWTVGQDLDVPWASYGRPLHTEYDNTIYSSSKHACIQHGIYAYSNERLFLVTASFWFISISFIDKHNLTYKGCIWKSICHIWYDDCFI